MAADLETIKRLVGAPIAAAGAPGDVPEDSPLDEGEDVAESADYVKDPGKLWEQVKSLKDAALRLRQDEERDWLHAWSYYRGKHWVTWKTDGRLVDIERADVPKIVLNFIMHVVQTRLGHLVKNKPIPVGLPASNDEDSRNATRVGEKALQAYWRKLKQHRKLAEAILWMLVTGNGFWKVFWDPGAGGDVELPPGKMADGSEIPGKVTRGDLACEMARPHEVLFEPGATTVDETQRAIHRTFRPVMELKARFKGSANVDKIKALDPATDQGAATLRQLYGFEGTVPAEVHNRCEVLEVWQRPTEEYPQGLFAVFTGDGTFIAGEPIEEGLPHIPFVHFREMLTDSFYGTSTARQLIDINKILDIEFSQQEHVRKVHRPKVLMPYQANISQEAWDRTDDECVRYFHPYEPKAFTPASYNGHEVELRNALVSLMKELGGNFDILSGKAQSDVRSGRMVAYLQEYAGTILGTVAQNIEQALEDAWNIMLRILQAKLDEERTETVVGRNRRMEILSFKGADLKGVAAIIVQPGSALPMSRAEKYDRIENWMDKGWLDPQRGLKMLDLVDPDAELWAEDEMDRENADEVVFKLKNLQIPAVQQARQIALMKYGPALQASAMAPPPPPMAPPGMMPPGAPPGPGAMPPPPMAPPAPPGSPDPALLMEYEHEVLRNLGIEAFEFDNHLIFVEHINRGLRKTRVYRTWPPPLRAVVDAYVDWHIILGGSAPDDPLMQQAARAAGAPLRATERANAVPPTSAPGGVGGVAGPISPALAESGSERSQGLPPVPAPPRTPGRGHV